MKVVWSLFVLLGLIGSPALAQNDAATDDNKPSDPAPAASETQPSESVPDAKPDEAKPDAPKPDAPKPDAPKPDAPKPDAPKPDAPKPDAPKPDESKPDESKPEAKPTAEVPAEAPAEAAPAEAAPAEAAPAQQPDAAPGEFKTDKEKTSYAIGVSIGRGLKRDGADIDPAVIGRGLADAFGGESLPLSDAQIREAIVSFQNRMRAFRAYQAENDAARKFLQENAIQEGVVVLPSGLQYRVLEPGDGPQPKPTDTVEVHYTGTLTDGTKFDSSRDGDKPFVTVVNGMIIQGWQQALSLMNVGSKWELVVPSRLGYGDNPRPGGKIKPGDVLVFEIELLGIKTPDKAGDGS